MTEKAQPVADRVTRRWPIVSGSIAIVLAFALGGIIAVRGNVPFEGDTVWMDEIRDHRSPFWEAPSLVMNFLGGGWFAFALPAVVILLLCVRREFWAALFLGASSAASAVVVQLFKSIFGRPRPDDMLVVSDVGSFPSGHAANAATLAVGIGIIVWRAWVWVAGVAYVVLMMLSRTYLGVHWVTDTIGGAAIGAAVVLIIWAPLAHRLRLDTGGRSGSVVT